MCGITGFFSAKDLSSEVILKMNHAIKHRGPDDEGFLFGSPSENFHYSGEDSADTIKAKLKILPKNISGSLAMGFRRLSIVDLSEKGHQPMRSQKGNVITFNGEIYNFRELRAEMISLGETFNSGTDTEVILKGYEIWGEGILRKLDGMFSICIFDAAREKLFFARDRFGLKPLFYFQSEEGFFWASEIKALIKSGQIHPEINWEGVESNFAYQTTIPPNTCFKKIKSIKPANFLVFDLRKNTYSEKEYWKIPEINKSEITKKEAAEKIEQLLKKSIAAQLKADLPAISMMSGGIDSTLLAYFTKAETPSLESFTIEYRGTEAETQNACTAAEKFQLKHSVKKVSDGEILKNLKEDIAHFEEPYTSLEVLLNAVKYAKEKNYKIILSGNGADEIFGGYSHLQKFERWKKLRKIRFIRHFFSGNTDFGKKIKTYFEQNSTEDFFMSGQGGMTKSEISELFKKNVTAQKKQWEKPSYQAYFQEDFQKSLASHHAFRDDLSAMKLGTEFRYPYLSNALSDYVAQLPEHIRYNGKTNKPLLREVASRYLPEDILKAPKRGFCFPMKSWFEENKAFRNFIFEHIDLLKKRNIFCNKTISRWQKSMENPHDFYRIWQLVTFEIWHQTYLD